jgi:Tfp pilus assembly protein PilX
MRTNHRISSMKLNTEGLVRLGSPRGVALILVMLAMLVLSVLAASIVFTARSETFASYNYKLDTQADYLAKAGVQRTLNWLRSSGYRAANPTLALANYQVTTTGNPFNLYIANSSPVKCLAAGSTCSSAGGTVQLIGYGGASSNYPSAITNSGGTAIPTAFRVTLNDPALVSNRISGDTANSGYFMINATLLNYQTVNVKPAPTDPNILASCITAGSVTTCPVETWLITSRATWTGASAATATTATAEELAIVQPIYWPTWGNALYGFCSVSMTGSAGTCTDAFNSSLGPYAGGNGSVAAGQCDSGATNVISTGAGVGANGGVTLGSNVTVGGNVTIGNTPTAGCSASGYTGSVASVLGEVINGPHIDPPAMPTFPAGFPGTAANVTLTGSSSQSVPDTIAAWTPALPWPTTPPSGGPPLAASTADCMTGLTCNGTSSNPYLLNTIKMTGSGTLSMAGGLSPLNPVYYDINCIDMQGGSIAISGYVVLNVLGSSSCTGSNGLALTGNGISNGIACTAPCTNIPPSAMTINYAGTTKGVAIGGNGAMAAVINAPYADVSLGGGGANGYMVGSIQANNISVMGGYPVHYDVQLARLGGSLGTMVSTAYGRKKM